MTYAVGNLVVDSAEPAVCIARSPRSPLKWGVRNRNQSRRIRNIATGRSTD